MKPIQLQISGLNSFREKTTVDFERLLQDGLFGIFGPTGSGKSTILDAITLALYGKVRRAPGGMGGIINVAEQRCAVSLTFEIGRNGGRQRYTVERLFGRNKGGGIETKKARISEHRDGVQVPITEKKNELKEKVEEILGITIDDFLRAVVLPQGAFAEFLGLEPRERSAVLQRLFGLHHYGDRLTTMLKGRQEELARGRAEIEGRLAELRAYDDDALAAAEASVEMLAGEQAAADAAHDAARKLYDDGALLHARLTERRALMDGSENRRAIEGELAGMRERIALAERSMAVRPALDARQAARERHLATSARHRAAVAASEVSDAALVSVRGELDRAARDYPDRFNAICAEIGRLETLVEKMVTLDARRAELRRIEERLALLEAAFAERAVVHAVTAAALREIDDDLARMEAESAGLMVPAGERELMRRMSVAAEALRGRERELVAMAADADEAERGLLALVSSLDAARGRESAGAGELVALRRGAEALGASARSMAEERERLMAEGRRLVVVLSEVEGKERSVADDERDLLAATRRLAEIESQLEGSRLSLREAVSREALARGERDAVRALREETYRHQALAALLEDLHDGAPCPLCGSIEHPAPHHPSADTAGELAAIDRELARAEGWCVEAEQRSREVERIVAAGESGIETTELAIESLAERIAAGRAAVERLLGELPEPVGSAAELEERVATMRGGERELKEHLDATSLELVALAGRIESAEAAQRELSEARARLEAELENGRRGAGLLRDREAGLRAALEKERAELIAMVGGGGIDDVEVHLEGLRHRDVEAERLALSIAARREERVIAVRAADDASAALDRERKEKEEAEVRRDMLGAMIEAGSAEVALLAGEAIPGGIVPDDAEGAIAERVAERDTIQKVYERAREAHARAATEAEVAAERVASSRSELLRDDEAAREADAICALLLRRHGFDRAQDVLAGELAEEELDTLRDAAERIVRELEDARRRLDDLEREIAGRDITDEALAALEASAAISRMRREEAILALGGAREKLRECREKNAEWKKMGARESESAGALATMEQLGKYLRANGFVEYLSNERLVEICRLASRQLAELTGGRFEIGARPKDGFYIRDYGNGGAERAPSSLSGGETFLVSLSLAIALSDTIQLGRAPLEFFFLDEGFGTLDGDLLETVMGSLDRLRSKDRAIGVISHVTQLREWIPRRLIVSPADEQHGSRLRYEVA